MPKIIAAAGLALTVALTSLPLTFSPAAAQEVELYLGRDGPTVRMRDNCDPRRENCRRGDDRYDRRNDDREFQRSDRGCTPERALNKAERLGLRRVRLLDSGRRTVDVVGRTRHGERVVVSFDRRDRRCGVLR